MPIKGVGIKDKFTLNYKFLNNGEDQWPEKLELRCILGYYSNITGAGLSNIIIPPLQPNESNVKIYIY